MNFAERLFLASDGEDRGGEREGEREEMERGLYEDF